MKQMLSTGFGQHPALVTPELWLQVQDVLATHDKTGEKIIPDIAA